jgi:hypothetical protein
MVLTVFLTLFLVVAGFVLVPRILARAPSRVPQKWTDEYGTRDRITREQ